MNHVKLAHFCGGSRMRKDFLLRLKWQKVFICARGGFYSIVNKKRALLLPVC